MSVYSQYTRPAGRKVGKNKGVAKQHKDRKYREAVERQQQSIDRGYYVGEPNPLVADGHFTPAHIGLFLRKEDRS